MSDRWTTLELDKLATRPLLFMLRYIRGHAPSHIIILVSVIAAVACATLSQYAVKHLVDVLSAHDTHGAWMAFILLAGLITADNACWRIGGWVATHSFVAVTGDMRRDLFQHLTGHAPAYFVDRQPGTLAGRITATANAIFQVENTCAWNVLPPAFAVMFSIVMLAGISPMMALVLVLVASTLGMVLARMAAAGRDLHRDYATTAANVDGELVDVINNMSLVRAFGARNGGGDHRPRRGEHPAHRGKRLGGHLRAQLPLSGQKSVMAIQPALAENQGKITGGLGAGAADLRQRLDGKEAQLLAARAGVRRLARELAVARRLLKFAGGSPLPARPRPPSPTLPLPLQTDTVPRRRAALLTDTVIYHLDSCQNLGAYTSVSGWAFRPAPGWDARATAVTLHFRHGATVYAAAASRVPRPDVAAYFAAQGDGISGGASGLDGVGFTCEILHDSLPAGVDLEIALRLECAGMACEQPTGTPLRC